MNWQDTLFPPNAERTVPWPEVGETVTLHRPTGWHELRLVAESGWQAWPPRLPDQTARLTYLLPGDESGVCRGNCPRLERQA